MRYEYLIWPARPEPLLTRWLRAIRALFRHPGRTLFMGLILLLLATQLSAQQAGAGQGRGALRQQIRAAGYRVIIGLRPDSLSRGMLGPGRSAVSDAAAEAIARRLERKGLRLLGRVTIIPAVFGQVSEAALDSLLDDPNVEYVEADEPMPLAVRSTGKSFRYAEDVPWGIPRVTAPDAWALGGSAAFGAGVRIAYLDSGGDSSHPDLLYAGGYNAMTGSSAPSAWADDVGPCYGHGTHVAGTMAARHNDQGVVGVAPDASLYAIKVFQDVSGSCLAYQSSQIAGLNWAVNNGIRVVSISIGGTTYNSSYQTAITAATSKGVYVVASAGNNGTSTLTYPGNYTDALAVGALDPNNNRSGYSNYGPKLYISAPGDNILSTLPGGYGYKSGTSMATPHVAGVIALLLARYPGISRADLLTRLEQGALDLGVAGRDDLTGWGLARAREAMYDAASQPAPVPLSLALSPLAHKDTVTSGATLGHPDSATVSLSGDNSSSTAWSASARHAWTRLTTASGTGSGKVRWSRNPEGLAVGVYIDTITVSAGGLTAALTDTLAVLALPPPPSTSQLSVTVSPGSRYRAVKSGSTTLTLDSAAVTLSGTGAASAAWSASATKPWLSLTASAGTGSGVLRWSYNPTGLAAGTYVDTITVVVPNAINSPARVVDSLVVTASKGKTRRIGRTVSTGNSIDGGEGQAGLADSAYVEAEPA
ncbi:MAG TPA: S8 family serine peptidase, partial [Gemmatimonadales bacterium]